MRIGAILVGDAQLDGLGRPWLLASGPRRLVRFSEQAVLTKPRTGTMTERTPGVWRLQVTSEPDVVTGRTRRLSRTVRGSTADARRALQRPVTEAGAGLQGGADVTVATLLEQFLTTATLAATTRQDWTSVIDRHLIPGVGNIPLWRLSARDCDLLYHQMAIEGLGPSRVRNAHVVLHRACAQVVRWGWIVRNPVADATRPQVPRTTLRPSSCGPCSPSPEQQTRCSAAGSTSPPHGSTPRRAVWPSLVRHRPAGADRPDRAVRRRHTIGGVDREDDQDRQVPTRVTHAPSREVPRELRAASMCSTAADGRAFGTDRFIFTTDPLGQRPWRPELVTRRWERLRAKAGLEHLKIHGIRHFVATELLRAGIDLRTVANRLGHARTSTTLDIYWAWVSRPRHRRRRPSGAGPRAMTSRPGVDRRLPRTAT